MLSWIEINKKNLIYNLKQFKKYLSKNVALICVIKSNAYGAGIVQIAKIIQSSKLADKLAVVNNQEAELLIKNKICLPIIILSYWEQKNISLLIKNNVEFPVYRLNQIRYLNYIAAQNKTKAKINVKIDVGTTRLGINPDECINFLKKIDKYKNIKIINLFSHFANAEENLQHTKKQLIILKKLREATKIPCHIACSAAIVMGAEFWLDGVRLGKCLYGDWPSEKTKKRACNKINLKPIFTWKTKSIQIKEVQKNTYIGYGLSYKTKRKTKIATLPVGYYEGYPYQLSNKGRVYIDNQYCPVRGKICMNMMMVDVTNVKNMSLNYEIELIGMHITPDEISQKTKLNNYIIYSNIHQNIPRIYH